jgi:hypothetical protein
MYESSEEQLMMSYAEQREERLRNAISEWTLEDEVTASDAYDSIIKMVKEDALYFKKQYDKQMSILFKMGYYGPLEDMVSEPEPHLKPVPGTFELLQDQT